MDVGPSLVPEAKQDRPTTITDTQDPLLRSRTECTDSLPPERVTRSFIPPFKRPGYTDEDAARKSLGGPVGCPIPNAPLFGEVWKW